MAIIKVQRTIKNTVRVLVCAETAAECAAEMVHAAHALGAEGFSINTDLAHVGVEFMVSEYRSRFDVDGVPRSIDRHRKLTERVLDATVAAVVRVVNGEEG